MENINMSLMNYYQVIFILQCVLDTRSYAVLTKTAPHNLHDKVVGKKYILLWQADRDFKSLFGDGQEVFFQNDCLVDSCFITSDRNMFEGDLRTFDAILFNGWDVNWYEKKDLPDKRHHRQKYVYVQRESAANYYICHTDFDDFFNWTMTYKLDSDIVFPHIYVRDKYDRIVGPKLEMHWNTNMPEIDATIATDLESKNKTAAWFYINCEPSRLNRNFVDNLQRALRKYNLKIDVYGKCGPLTCPVHECDQILEQDYYFFLALEESFAEDYVTGNVLRALRNNVVPIVYGGSKYSRFLPPSSYLDGTSQTPEELAAVMNSLIENHTLYSRYFRWKSYYSFILGQANPSLPLEGLSNVGPTMCDLCQALHDKNKLSVSSVYKDFRKWWYPNYAQKCTNNRAAKSSSNVITQIEKKKNLTTSMPTEQRKKQQKRGDKQMKSIAKHTTSAHTQNKRQQKKITNNQKESKVKNRKKTKKTINRKKLRNKAKKPFPIKKQATLKDDPLSWLAERENLRKNKVSILRKTFAGLPNRVAEALTHGISSKLMLGYGDRGQGGGGGGVVRNTAWVANEFNRIRASVLVNNFDIYKR